jgi:glutathione S-transferase
VPWRALQDLQNAPKGKFPYTEDNGKKIADSAFIIDYLKATYGDPLEEQHFTAHDRAVGHSMRVMLEEHLYWILMYTQWLEEAAWEATTPYSLATCLRPSNR